ncbi:hypothetical protein N9993_01445 [bacterium]|jgi:hypothetical protein|nr:hypothetical protein [bacterium]
MNDLFEIVEDLKDIDTFGSDTTAFEDILVKWQARLEDAQADAERQYEMFAGVAKILDKRYETFEMDDGA